MQRIKQIVEMELWSRRLLKEFCQMLLSESYSPQQPDMVWDYPLYWTGTERRGNMLFCEVAVNGKHMENFGAFCEDRFMQQSLDDAYEEDDSRSS